MNKKNSKHITLIIDVFSISALILIISNFLLDCNQSSCFVLLDRVKFFPWTDYSENLVGGVNISRGYKFGYDFSQPHFPGIYLYLGLIFKIIGLNNIPISDLLAYSSIVISSLAMMLMVLLFYRTTYGEAASYIIGIIAFLTLHMNTTFVMSETLAFWLTVPLITSSIKYLEFEKFGSEILLLPLIITFAGLGFWGISVFPYLMILIKEGVKLNEFILREKNKILVFVLTLGALIFLTAWGVSDFKKVYFWSVEINKVIRPDYVLNIKKSFRDFFVAEDFNIRIINIFSVLCFVLVLKIKEKITGRTTIFLIIIASSIVWRVSGGYKVLPLLSIVLGVLLYLWQCKAERADNFCKKNKIIIMIILVSVAAILSRNSVGKINPQQSGDTYYTDDDLCRVNSTTKCLCVQVMVFGPQAYLFNDIRQCKYQMNTWADRLGTSGQYLEIINKSIDKKEGAYLIPPDEFTRDDSVLLSIIGKIKKTYTCASKVNGFVLCKGDL